MVKASQRDWDVMLLDGGKRERISCMRLEDVDPIGVTFRKFFSFSFFRMPSHKAFVCLFVCLFDSSMYCMLISVSEALFYVCRDTLFQDPFWGVSDFPVSYHGYLYFSIFSMWILICWCEENTGRHFKGFYLSKILRHAKQQTQGV